MVSCNLLLFNVVTYCLSLNLYFHDVNVMCYGKTASWVRVCNGCKFQNVNQEYSVVSTIFKQHTLSILNISFNVLDFATNRQTKEIQKTCFCHVQTFACHSLHHFCVFEHRRGLRHSPGLVQFQWNGQFPQKPVYQQQLLQLRFR